MLLVAKRKEWVKDICPYNCPRHDLGLFRAYLMLVSVYRNPSYLNALNGSARAKVWKLNATFYTFPSTSSDLSFNTENQENTAGGSP